MPRSYSSDLYRIQPPELLNRISEVVQFARLQRSNMEAIVRIGLRDIARRLEEGQNMTIDCSEAAIDSLATKGYDMRYGARPLNRVLASDLLNPLSRLVLDGGVVDGDIVRVRTRAEAEKHANESEGGYAGFLSSDGFSSQDDDIVVMRNHRSVEDAESEMRE
jgi:ATP-dependent Clp protease ATP-binding subunit ClpB